MLLMRQPWNAAERAAGSVFAAAPEAFTPADHPPSRTFCTGDTSQRTVLYHRRLFDTRDWPEGAESEGRFRAEPVRGPDGPPRSWAPHRPLGDPSVTDEPVGLLMIIAAVGMVKTS